MNYDFRFSIGTGNGLAGLRQAVARQPMSVAGFVPAKAGERRFKPSIINHQS
jgi:hypothetical protein